MDPVAHVLAGSAIARAGFQPSIPEKRATFIAVVAANVPDLDLMELLWAPHEQFVYHHRSLTHSLVGWVAATFILSWGFRRLWKDLPARPLHLLVALAFGSHLMMDLITPWGTRVGFPFDDTSYSLNTTFIWDLGFWVILAAPWFFRRWVPEIRVFRVALVTVVLFVLMCGLSRQVASVGHRHMLNRHQVSVERAGVFPTLFAPVFWNVVAQDETHSYQAFFALPHGADSFRSVRPHNLDHPAVKALRKGEGLRYFQWARFPVATLIEEPDGVTRVEVRDLRFMRRHDPKEKIPGFVFRRRMQQLSGEAWSVVHPE